MLEGSPTDLSKKKLIGERNQLTYHSYAIIWQEKVSKSQRSEAKGTKTRQKAVGRAN